VPASAKRNIDDCIDLWHCGAAGDQPLHEYLGMTWEEYALWVETSQLPEHLKDRYID